MLEYAKPKPYIPKPNFYAGVIFHNNNYYLSRAFQEPYIYFFLEWLLTKPAKENHCIYLDVGHALAKNLNYLIDLAGVRQLYVQNFGAATAVMERDNYVISSFASVHETVKKNYNILIYVSECGEILAQPELNGFANAKINLLRQPTFTPEFKSSRALSPIPIASILIIPPDINYPYLKKLLNKHPNHVVMLHPEFKLANAINVLPFVRTRHLLVLPFYYWNLNAYKIFSREIFNSNLLFNRPKVTLGYVCNAEIAAIFKDLVIPQATKQTPIASGFFKPETRNPPKFYIKAQSDPKTSNILSDLELPPELQAENEKQQTTTRSITFDRSIRPQAQAVEPSVIFSLLKNSSSES